jgi:hypothetical protein
VRPTNRQFTSDDRLTRKNASADIESLTPH